MKVTVVLGMVALLQVASVDVTDAKISIKPVGKLMDFQRVRKFSNKPTLHKAVGDQQVSVQDACIHAHNEVRALHVDTPSVTWDDKLAKQSEKWALHLASLGRLEHSSGVGENLAFKASSLANTVYTPADAVWMWYQESVDSDYDYSRPGGEQRGVTGHFTQLVWKPSVRVGCGVASIQDGKFWRTYIVAQYEPRGNMMGEYLDNVMPMKPGAKAPKTSLVLEKQGVCIEKTDKCQAYKAFCSQTFIRETCAGTCTC